MTLPKIPFTVIVLGFVSLFNDIASEMIYPIVPIFLTSVLGAPVSVIGFIEGIAEATASLMKFVFGYISDKMQKRKIFVTGGYGASAVSKLLMGIAFSWHFVLFARVIDRLGKGLRTSARDSILLQNATKENKGLIFGFHRAMDSAGAVLGPIFALILLYFLKNNIRLTFLIAFIPSVIGVILLILFVKEKRHEVKEKSFPIKLKWSGLSPSFKLFFIISMIFALGNSSDAFLILRAKDLGMATTLVVFTYVLYNLSQTIFATPAGQLADKIGARKVYAIGLLVFALVYALFGLMQNPVILWVLFPIYGIYIAFTDGVSKAYISEFITEKESGTYFGMYQTGTAVAGFFASFFAGLLWNQFGASATFYYGAALALLAFLVLGWGKMVKKI
ncbi:MAG: Permeases of the major facilitator superfamily [Candidatus Gottesmanbacteria bacterium GW2011_GWC2_39_8]|uniref:Permeases of the major facilitator superfamily n=1 Tax=Candidatus Gottesmanbacteria bacterium GW2011_GWC2_39_8 TaxID=1618450 RepID=A0A0G0SC86_9BACT|nr:MAG: Permeases of the major facilitator superfamily [Candidatus Gottesmanbacteria bacterium GW2011_GWC2_39_8]